MNNPIERVGATTLLAAFNLAALPSELCQLTERALRPGASMEAIHLAARAIADEAPVTCLEGVIATLIFLANPEVDMTSTPVSTTADNKGE